MNLEPNALNLGVVGALLFVIGMMFRYTEKQADSMSKRDKWLQDFVIEQTSRVNGQAARSDRTVERVVEMGATIDATLQNVDSTLETICGVLEDQDKNEVLREASYKASIEQILDGQEEIKETLETAASD